MPDHQGGVRPERDLPALVEQPGRVGQPVQGLGDQLVRRDVAGVVPGVLPGQPVGQRGERLHPRPAEGVQRADRGGRTGLGRLPDPAADGGTGPAGAGGVGGRSH